MTRLHFALGVCLSVFSLPAVAAAQPGQQPPPPPPPGSSPGYGYGAYGMTIPGVHEHEGLFLRLNIGVGALRARAELDENFDIKGVGGMLQVAFGANISPGLIIFGELFGHGMIDPTVEYAGVEVDEEDATAGLGGIGVGMAYYLPANVYFSGTLAVSRLRRTEDVEGDEVLLESKTGPAFLAQIGKEWWVSDNWGLGLAGQFILSSNKDEEIAESPNEVTFTTVGFGLLFSATYD